MTDKEKFLAYKIPLLIKEGKYTRPQAIAVAYSLYRKEGEKQKAQQGYGDMWNIPNIESQAMSPQQDFSVKNQDYLRNIYTPAQPMTTVSENNAPIQTAQYQGIFGNSGIPYADVNKLPKLETDNYTTENKQSFPQQVGTVNPFSGVSLENSIYTLGQGLGSKDPYKTALGADLTALKLGRMGLSGFATGREDKRIQDEYRRKLNEDQRGVTNLQQGGMKNSEILASNAVTNNPNGNVNTESGEFIKRTNGMVQPVVGEPHIKNGKKADGVDVHLNDGDKVLSNYIKLRPADIKELKDRYNISLKKGDTPAKALEKIEAKIGLKKETKKLAETAEKLEKALKIKDQTTRELSLETLQTIVATQNEKIDNLKQVSSVAFEDLFEAQEKVEKKDTSKLYDKNGEEVTEENKTSMQQGGIFDLANKYGISTERAKELIQMQQGGMQPQQEEQTEGQASNPQNGVPQEQIIQAVMQMLQQGIPPEEIVQNLISQGLPQEQAVQVVQMMMQQSQGEEQVEGQMSNPQEEQMETAQQGGIRVANQYEDPNLYKKQGATSEGWDSFGELLKSKPQEVLTEIKRVHPELYSKYFKGDKINKNNIAEFQIAVNNKYDSIVKDAESLYGKDSQQVKDLQSQIDKDKFLTEQGNIRDIDAMLGNFTSTRPNFALEVLPKEDLDKVNKAGVNTASELRDKFPDLYKKYVEPKGLKSDFWLGNIKTNNTQQNPTVEAQVTPQKEETTTQSQSTGRKNYFPMLPQDLRTPPSAIPSLLKSEIALGRIEPIKQTVEPYLAEQERARQADVARIEQSGMSPQQQEALLSQGLASSQIASNDAISKVEGFNAQNQYQTDQFNIGQRAKEDISNQQFSQDYQNKMLGSISNTERDWRAFNNEGNLQNRANWSSVENMNLLNRMSENYKYNIGNGVEYIPSVSGNIANNAHPTPEQLANWTPEQLEDYKRNMANLAKKTMFNQQSVS